MAIYSIGNKCCKWLSFSLQAWKVEGAQAIDVDDVQTEDQLKGLSEVVFNLTSVLEHWLK